MLPSEPTIFTFKTHLLSRCCLSLSLSSLSLHKTTSRTPYTRTEKAGVLSETMPWQTIPGMTIVCLGIAAIGSLQGGVHYLFHDGEVRRGEVRRPRTAVLD